MKQEYKMEQEEMDKLLEISKSTSSRVIMIGEAINAYWKELGKKYGFKPMTAESSSRGKLYFLAESTGNCEEDNTTDDDGSPYCADCAIEAGLIECDQAN